MICPHCRQTTTAVAGRCGLCNQALDRGPVVATGVLTPIHPGGPPGAPDKVTNLGTSGSNDVTNLPPLASGRTPLPRGLGETGPLAPGQAFGPRYHVIRLLGIGGMGAVYQAWDDDLGVAVAIKIIRPEVTDDPLVADDLERRFKRELLLAREVTHKNVVRIHDLGDIDGIKYITMPYIQGRDLATILRSSGKLQVPAALHIAKQVAAGLQAAHEAGVIHRDLKPANIMVDDDEHACIMDFGIARSAEGGGGTMLGAVVGTVAYMAPEQARGEAVDHRADIYAFGLILYDLLGGRRTGARSSSLVTELMARMQHAPAPIRTIDEQIPEAIERIIGCCLQPAADARYQTTAELIADLDALDSDGHPVAGRTLSRGRTSAIRIGPVSLPAPSWKWATAAALLIAVAAGGYVLRDRLGGAAAPVAVTGQPVSLAILPFRNASGDSSLDWLGSSFSEMLRTEVGASPQLRTVSADRLYQILGDLRISPDAAFDPPTLKRLADFSNSQTVVWGQYVKFGNEIRFDATLQNVGTARVVPLKASAVNEAALLDAVSQLANAVRENLALAPDIIKQLQASAFKPSSRSVQALRYYSEGLALLRQGKPSEALKKFEIATQEDGEFALAYTKLAQTYASLGYDGEADRFSQRAMELSEALPPREKYLIQANHARIRNDAKQAIVAYENLAKVAPDDLAVQFDLAALYDATGMFKEARDGYAKILERDPNYVSGLIAIGNVELKGGNPQGSLDYLNRALTIAIRLENDEGRANVLHLIGVAYRALNKPQDALRNYDESLAIKRRLGNKGGIAVTLNAIAQVQNRLANSEEALKSYTEALKLRREIGDKVGVGTTLIDFGVFYSARGKFDQALVMYREALQIQREVGNENYEAAVLNNIANVYFNKAQYDDALTNFQQSLQLREKSKNPRDTAQSLHNVGETYWKLGYFDRALNHLLRALELRRKAGDKRGAAIDAYSIGMVQEDQGRYAASISSKAEALKSFRELQDRTSWLAESLSGYGSVLAQVGRHDEAQKNLEEALGVARDLKHQNLIAQILNLQADGAFYRGDLKAARALVDQALQAAPKATDRGLLLKARVNEAKLLIQEGRATAAIPVLRTTAREADGLGLKYLATESSVWLGDALQNAKQYPEARRTLEAAVSQADRLGLRVLRARSRYLLATVLRLTGNPAEARRQHEAALRVLEEIRKEAAGDGERLMGRADLQAMSTPPTP